MMTPLGTLRRVDVRDAWKNEATDFTPWLQEHLERLNQVFRPRIGQLSAPE